MRLLGSDEQENLFKKRECKDVIELVLSEARHFTTTDNRALTMFLRSKTTETKNSCFNLCTCSMCKGDYI